MSCVGINIDCLERRSTTTRIEVKPEEIGKCSIKSIDIEFHGFSGIGNCLRAPYGLCRGTFARAQVVQDLQKSLTEVRIRGQKYSLVMRSRVLFCTKCPAVGWSCLYCKTRSRRLSASGTYIFPSLRTKPSVSTDQRESESEGGLLRIAELIGSDRSEDCMSRWSCS